MPPIKEPKEQSKQRRHVTTACDPCRESKVKVRSRSAFLPARVSLTDRSRSVTVGLQRARIVRTRAKSAATKLAQINESRS